MKNDCRGKNARNEPLTISIRPTLLVTAMSKSRIGHTQSSSFAQPGDLVYLVGLQTNAMAGSEWAHHFLVPDELNRLPDIDLQYNLQLYRTIHNGIEQHLFSSIHDVSDGGPLCSAIESGFGNMLGMNLVFESDSFHELFAEGPGQFIVSVPKDKEKDFLSLFSTLSTQHLGVTTEQPIVRVSTGTGVVMEHPLKDFFHVWQEEL